MPFDVKSLTVTGAPVPVVVGVRRSTGQFTAATQLAVSDTGTMVYIPGPATAVPSTRGLALQRAGGVAAPLTITPADYSYPRVSPDGTAAAVQRLDGDAADVWTIDLSGATAMRRLTFGGESRYPVWSADGRRVTFQSVRDGLSGIFWQAADGSGTAERLTTATGSEEHRPESWSRDGSTLLFSILKDSTHSLWVFKAEGKRVERFGNVTSAEPLSATFSPDGRWVAYASTASAGGVLSPDRGVFVEPYPATGERHQAPKTALDFHPVWSPDGETISYVATGGSSRPLISVPVTTRPSITFGRPVELLGVPAPDIVSNRVREYDALPGGRFLSLAPPSDDVSSSTPVNEIRVVVNWFDELKRLVPSN
jgi:dipeptidyl aminopeptidase/acylaminoacyl peptidase